jgi:chromosome partitioning protein
VIVPVQSSNFSIEAATRMVKFIDTIRETSNPSLQLDGILLTMHENNTRASFEAKKLLFGLYPNQVFKTTIPKNITVSESTFHDKPVLIFDPNAPASKAYFSLVDEIIEKHETRSLMLLSGFDNHHFRNDEIKFGKSESH